MKKIISLVFAVLFMVGVSGCADDKANTTYSNYDLGATGRVELGTIVDMTPVTTSGSHGIGTLAGAGAGAAAGSMIGGNTAVNIIGGIGGALIGGMIGSATEGALTSTDAYEFVVRKENGSLLSLVQTNELSLRPGDKVLLANINGTTRIRSRAAYY